jgi:hypothetical protein
MRDFIIKFLTGLAESLKKETKETGDDIKEENVNKEVKKEYSDEVPLENIEITEDALDLVRLWASELAIYLVTTAKYRAKYFMSDCVESSDIISVTSTLMDPSTIANLSSMINMRLSAALSMGLEVNDLLYTELLTCTEKNTDDEEER